MLALEGLNAGLLINRQHHGTTRCLPVQRTARSFSKEVILSFEE
jgi:hypothetical protein